MFDKTGINGVLNPGFFLIHYDVVRKVMFSKQKAQSTSSLGSVYFINLIVLTKLILNIS